MHFRIRTASLEGIDNSMVTASSMKSKTGEFIAKNRIFNVRAFSDLGFISCQQFSGFIMIKVVHLEKRKHDIFQMHTTKWWRLIVKIETLNR